MQLTEVFDQLVYGELSNTVIGKKGIDEGNMGAMLTHINLGLYELYKRFNLKKNSVIIKQNEAIATYELHTRFAQSNALSTESVKYIMDAGGGTPFTNNVLKIETVEKLVVKDNEEPQYPINRNGVDGSITLNTLRSFTMPTPVADTLMKVVYRANHPRLKANIDEPSLQEIELPVTHLEALLLFVASRYHSSLPTLDGINEGTAYIARFERSCLKLSDLGLTNVEEEANQKLWVNGWV